MRTAIVSDLHLGSAFGEDLLRDPGIRRTLLDELDGAERLILLGDALELRELPLATALENSRPFFEELGETMAGRPVILVPGNHDHRLAEPLLEELAIAGRRLGLEHRREPAEGATAQIAAWLGDAELSVAYPGIWLREDVYASHGHYMDCHLSLPRVECLAAATVMRALGSVPNPATPENYEQVLQPVYGLANALVQAGVAQPKLVNQTRPSTLAWHTISGRDSTSGRARRAAIRAAIGIGIPASVWAINRLLRSDFNSDFSASAITHSGIAAATELTRRLRIDAAQVIVGHTHRGGPLETESEWTLPSGGRLHNTGSWVFASVFHRPGTPPGPYWPGTITWLNGGGPPIRKHLLLERSGDELRATVAQLAPSTP